MRSPLFDRYRLAALVLLLTAAVLPAWLTLRFASPPGVRNIHIEAYRYGFSPSRITVNRGDRLHLTFSSRDTGQSFFLPDYDLHAVITPGSTTVEVYRLSRPEDPPARQEAVEITAGLPGPAGFLFGKSSFRNHTYNGPLHGTERGELIVRPNLLAAASLGLLCALPFAAWMLRMHPRPLPDSRPVNLFSIFPRLRHWVRMPGFSTRLALPMMGIFYFLVLAAFLGTKVSGRNAAPMVIWVLWISLLILVLVPLGGRLWCLLCPIPLLGEWLQRTWRTDSAGPGLAERMGAWPRLLLFLLLATFSTTLAALPPATGWLLLGLAAAALATSVIPEPRFFCRCLCPINGFLSLYSMTGRLMVRSASPPVCSGCARRTCLLSSEAGRGCPYGLCLGDVGRNNDCGLCLECVKSCAYDNVALLVRRRGWDRELTSYGEAWQAIVMLALAAVYGLVQLGPWDRVRDWIDLLDRQNWRAFWAFAAFLWFLCLAIVPGLFYLAIRAGIPLAGRPIPAGLMFRTAAAALVPLGLSAWMAFALSLLLSMLTFVLQSLSDPFNWGWDLLGTAGCRWHIIGGPLIPWLQVLCLILGFSFSLRTAFDCWEEQTGDGENVPLASLPTILFLWAASCGLTWFYAG